METVENEDAKNGLDGIFVSENSKT
jgi:hypothetical protein